MVSLCREQASELPKSARGLRALSEGHRRHPALRRVTSDYLASYAAVFGTGSQILHDESRNQLLEAPSLPCVRPPSQGAVALSLPR